MPEASTYGSNLLLKEKENACPHSGGYREESSHPHLQLFQHLYWSSYRAEVRQHLISSLVYVRVSFSLATLHFTLKYYTNFIVNKRLLREYETWNLNIHRHYEPSAYSSVVHVQIGFSISCHVLIKATDKIYAQIFFTHTTQWPPSFAHRPNFSMRYASAHDVLKILFNTYCTRFNF